MSEMSGRDMPGEGMGREEAELGDSMDRSKEWTTGCVEEAGDEKSSDGLVCFSSHLQPQMTEQEPWSGAVGWRLWNAGSRSCGKDSWSQNGRRPRAG